MLTFAQPQKASQLRCSPRKAAFEGVKQMLTFAQPQKKRVIQLVCAARISEVRQMSTFAQPQQSWPGHVPRLSRSANVKCFLVCRMIPKHMFRIDGRELYSEVGI